MVTVCMAFGSWENPCIGHCTFKGLIILFLMSQGEEDINVFLLSSAVYWRLTTDEQCLVFPTG